MRTKIYKAGLLTYCVDAVSAVSRASWRFTTGAPMDGVPKTDATWLHAAVRSTRPDGKAASRWSHMPRAARAGIRLGTTGALAATGYAYAAAPEAVSAALEVTGAGVGTTGAAWAGYKAADAVLTYRHHRDWVWPLHVALRGALQLPSNLKPSRYLHIPQNFNEITGEMLRIELPADYVQGMDGGNIVSIIRTKLALQDAQFSFRLDGRNHHLVAVQSPRPPAKVLYSDPAIQALVKSRPASAPLLGLSHTSKPVDVDLDSDAPHILVNAGTGGGKSVILRCIAAQMAYHGAIVVILDRKRTSHKWARKLPNVIYCRTPAEMHDVLEGFIAPEIERRNMIAEEWEGDDKDAPVGPRICLLFEEVNATMKKLKRYWEKIRTNEDPKESPALEAFDDMMFMGRSGKMNAILVAQSATANAVGGPEVRENFGCRILARYTLNAWKMLVPEISPAPKATRHTGRAQVCLGGTANETQIMFLTDQEAAELAVSGVVSEVRSPGSQVPTPRSEQGQDTGAPQAGAGTRPDLHIVTDPSEELLSLRDLVRNGHVMEIVREAVEREPNATSERLEEMALQTLRDASKRLTEGSYAPFPKSSGYRGATNLYRVGDIREWVEVRQAVRAKASGE